MPGAHAGRAIAVALGVVLTGGSSASALNPALDVSQYAHTAWKIRDGFVKDTIYAIAQTPDGYLWLGTGRGLYRFDGVRAAPWQPLDLSLPSQRILQLLATRDGALWIGTDNGLARVKDRQVTRYLPGRSITGPIVEVPGGAIWASTWASGHEGRLCAIQNGLARCNDDASGPGSIGLYQDSKGSLWSGTQNGLWRWNPAPPTFVQLPFEFNGIQGFAEGDDGSLLVATNGAVRRIVDGKAELAYPFPPSMRRLQSRSLFRDRDGGLWIGSAGGGVVHVHHGTADAFSRVDGLSGDNVWTIFEDREGDVWISTDEGLDRFRDTIAAVVSTNQGLSSNSIASVLASRDGSVWMATSDGLNKWNEGSVTVYREHPAPSSSERKARTGRRVREVAGGGFPRGPLSSLFQDSLGRVWVSAARGVGYLASDRFVWVSGLPGGLTRAIVEDSQANLWIANQDQGLFRVSLQSGGVAHLPSVWSQLGDITALSEDPSRKGLWLGFYQGGIAYLEDGEIRLRYTAADGLGGGTVHGIQVERGGTVWVAAEGGYTRVKDGRLARLTGKNGLPCDGVQWAIADDAQWVWLDLSCGLVRIARPDLDAWASTVEANRDAKRAVIAPLFDILDGVRTFPSSNYYAAPVVKSSDGILWFMSQDGVGVVDPRRLSFNIVPPPVRIEQVTADRRIYDSSAAANPQIGLPARTRDLQIDYTALSFVAPEKIRFRYKLEGRDGDWQDVGNRRQAFYDNLSPRNYRFRVQAANNSGVWNEEGASLDFSVAPAYSQTTWFRLTSFVALLALLAALYQLRLRYIARQFNLRFEERVNERTRIARDLHDTLLQSFQGVLLKFHAATHLLPDRPAEARSTLETVIEQARQAITEGRDAVQGLRSSTLVKNDLAWAIMTFCEDLGVSHKGDRTADVQMHVEGAVRDLVPLVRDDVYRVACEALRNAFRHANAKHVEVELHFDPRELRLRVRDDGKGIDAAVLSTGREGHYGLAGMHERATLVGGKLTVWSELDSGTEIELTVPASVAYVNT